MANEPEGADELSDIEEIEGDDSTDWQAEHKKLTEKVIRSRERNKMFRESNKKIEADFDAYKVKHPDVQPPNKKDEHKKSDDIDFGELAYHNTQPDTVRIVHDDDVEYVRATVKRMGLPLREVLADEIVQGKLKAMQEARLVVNATPLSTRRTGGQGNELEIAYTKYLQTNKLPDDPALRMQVVNKRQERESMQNRFTPQAVVEG
jgi:hypothetical protein